MCEAGATDREIAQKIGVGTRTIYEWKNQFPQFGQALKVGKDTFDDRVELNLYHKAIGYTFDSEKIFQFQGEIIRAKTVEHIPPDTTAAIFWLKNRRPAQWRDRQDIEHTGTLTLEQIVMGALKPKDKT
jgi:hypothetical protein